MTKEFDAELVKNVENAIGSDGFVMAKDALSVACEYYEKQIAELKTQIPFQSWQHSPDTKTTPVKCLLCDAQASVIVHAPYGCTCSPNIIQPRCEHHYRRALDSNEDMRILEDFRVPLLPLKQSCPPKTAESEGQNDPNQ